MSVRTWRALEIRSGFVVQSADVLLLVCTSVVLVRHDCLLEGSAVCVSQHCFREHEVPVPLKGLGEKVGEVVIRVDFGEPDQFLLDAVPYVVARGVDVLCPGMMDRVLHHGQG